MRGRVGGGIKTWWSRPWLAAGVLLLLCLAVYLPGLASIPAIDRDEARFAQASRQMLESGDWVMPRVQDRPRLNKPPLVYWLQAGSAWVFSGGDAVRDAIWMYRVPSVLAATGTVFLTWLLAWRLSGPSVAFLAGSLLAVSPLVAFDAHQARADQVLLFFTTAAMACLWVCWHAPHRGRHPGWGWVLTFWFAVAAGVMTKGPITPLIAGLAVLCICLVGRSWRWVLVLKPLVGVAVLSAAVLPWVWAVANTVGWSAYGTLIWNETMGRAGGSGEGHLGPPGMHAVLLIALLWPASLTTAQAVRDSLASGWPVRSETDLVKPWWKRMWLRRIGKPQDAFLLAWAVPGWIFFELFGAKLAHYPMPLYPAVAILSARGVAAFTARKIPPGRLDLGIWLVVGLALVTAGMLAGLHDIVSHAGHALRGAFSVALATGAVGVMLVAAINAHPTSEQMVRLGRWAMLGSLVAVFTSGAAFIPGAESERIMTVVRKVEGWERRPIASTHRQDSMVFHTRGRVARLDGPALAAWRRDHPDGLVVLRPGELEALAVKSTHRVMPVPPVSGIVPGRDWVVLVPTLGEDERGRMANE